MNAWGMKHHAIQMVFVSMPLEPFSAPANLVTVVTDTLVKTSMNVHWVDTIVV